jgi:hypothetical protein
MPDIEARLVAIELRNSAVARDKAWETSLTRRSLIAFISYIVTGFLLVLLGSNAAWFYALLPVVGYLVSTLTLPYFRKFWQRHVYTQIN